MINFNWIHLFFMKDSNKRPITADILIKEALKSNDVKNVQPMFDQALTIYFQALLQCLASISSIGNNLKPRSSVLHRLKSLFMQLLEIVL